MKKGISMTTLITHAASGLLITKMVKKKSKWPFLFFVIISTLIPDLDVLAFKFKIPYEHILGHRGITHSIFFALLYSLSIGKIYLRFFSSPFSKTSNFHSFLFLITLSHSILDAFTNGGLGVAFFAPFNSERYFFPYRPIPVSPIGFTLKLYSITLKVLLWEFIIVLCPLYALYNVKKIYFK